MRKIIAAALALMCLLSACSQQDDTSERIRVGVCLAGGKPALYRNALVNVLACKGYYVNFSDAAGDQSQQHAQIADYITQQYDILIVEPVMALSADSILLRLKEANLPVVLMGKTPSEEMLELWNKACYVGFDQSQPGQLQGQIILNTLHSGDIGGDGQVSCAILAGPEDHAGTQLYAQNCMAALSENVDTALLATVYGDHTRAQGKALTEGLLATYGKEIDVLFCAGEDMTLGALEALESYGKIVNQDIYVVGLGGADKIVSLVQAGKLTGTVLADYDALGHQAANAVSRMLANDAQQFYTVDHIAKEAPQNTN